MQIGWNDQEAVIPIRASIHAGDSVSIRCHLPLSTLTRKMVWVIGPVSRYIVQYHILFQGPNLFDHYGILLVPLMNSTQGVPLK